MQVLAFFHLLIESSCSNPWNLRGTLATLSSPSLSSISPFLYRKLKGVLLPFEPLYSSTVTQIKDWIWLILLHTANYLLSTFGILDFEFWKKILDFYENTWQNTGLLHNFSKKSSIFIEVQYFVKYFHRSPVFCQVFS